MQQRTGSIAGKAALVALGMLLATALPLAYAKERAAQAKTLEQRVAALEKQVGALQKAVEVSSRPAALSPAPLLDYRVLAAPPAPAPQNGQENAFEFNGRTYYLTPLGLPR